MVNASFERPSLPGDSAACGGIGPGTVVLVVGPSGAGKDALLSGAAEQLTHDPAFHFPRRQINRSSHVAEGHDVLSEQEVTRLKSSRAYALSWQAHGLTYAIPAEIDSLVRAGGCVVFNASRTVIPSARQRYVDLKVVYVDAPRSLRALRLEARGRETAVEIRARLAREVTAFRPSAADAAISNDGSLAEGIGLLLATLRSFLPRSH